MQARTKNTVHEHRQVFVFLFKHYTREIILSRILLEDLQVLREYLLEEFKRMRIEAQLLRDKLALVCNDTEREARMTAYKLLEAKIAEVRADICELEIRAHEREERAAVRAREVREMEERAAVREMAERAAVREMEERERERERAERAAIRESNREVLRDNQQHEKLLNLSKEINQILEAKGAVRDNLIATSSEAERQRLERLLAQLQTREDFAKAEHEAYLKQGMATSL